MISHDRLFKELLSTFFMDFLELFFPLFAADIDRDSLVFMDKEVFTDVTHGEKHEADLVVKVRYRDKPSFLLIHTEHQAQPREEFGRRMFQYFARLYEKYGLPVYPIAVFSYESPKELESGVHRVEFLDGMVLEFQYRVVQLNRLRWRDFMNRRNPVASALMAKMEIAEEDRPKVKVECLRLLATLRLDPARMQLISGFVDEYLRLNEVEKAVFEEELGRVKPEERGEIMKIVTSWMEEGIQQGRQEGLQEGQKKEALTLILKLLIRRVGPIRSELEEQVRGLSLEQLEALGEALLDFSRVEDLGIWLQGQKLSGLQQS
jgi:predicted transposase YdaD